MRPILQLVRLAWRKPGFTILASLTLALGVGVSTAVFSVVNGVLLAPLPYPDPDSIVQVNTVFLNEKRRIPRVTGGDLQDLETVPGVFSVVAHYYGDASMGVQLRDRAEFERIAFVSGTFFDVFRLAPLAGHWFDATAEDEAVVSIAFANSTFGSPSAALGQTLSVEGQAYRIAGVAPLSLEFPHNAKIWLSMPRKLSNTNRNSYNYRMVGRLSGSLATTNQRVEALAERLAKTFVDNRSKSFVLVPIGEQITGALRPTLRMLMAAVLLVLLIACANVANLQLARATGRVRELAVRTALGATRWQLARQLLAESLSLSVPGAAAGVLLAFWIVGLLVKLAPVDLPRAANIGVDGPVLAFAVCASILASLVAGLAPALRFSDSLNLADPLQQTGGRGSSAGAPATRVRNVLVMSEIALSVVLSIGAGLLFRSFVALDHTDLGFDRQNVVVIYAHAPANKLDQAIGATRMFAGLLPQLQALPGVRMAAEAMGMPEGQYSTNGAYEISGRPETAGPKGPQALFRLAGPGYFGTLGATLLRGRDFTDADRYETPFVAVISQALARQSFGDQDPIGQQIRCGMDSPNWMTIIGVVSDVRSMSPGSAPQPELYMPLTQHPFMANELQIALRLAPGAPVEPVVEAARSLVRSANSEVAMRFTTLEAMVEDSLGAHRFRAVLVAAFALVALTLAMAGVHGVMAFVTAQRTSELGLRMALGAAPADLLGMVLSQAVRLSVWGALVGIACAAGAARVLEGMVFGVEPLDAWTYAAMFALTLLVTVGAALGPAIRAMRLDPLSALRRE